MAYISFLDQPWDAKYVLIPAKLKDAPPIPWTMTTGLCPEEAFDTVGWKANTEMTDSMQTVRIARILLLICFMNFPPAM